MSRSSSPGKGSPAGREPARAGSRSSSPGRGSRSRKKSADETPKRGAGERAVLRIDGEKILALMREAVLSEGRGSGRPAASWEPDPLLDKVFVNIVREFIHRNNRRTDGTASASPSRRSNGGALQEVMRDLKDHDVVSETLPVSAGDETSCIAAYRNKRVLGSGEYGTTYSFDAAESSWDRPGAPAKFALKVVHFNSLSDPRVYENILKEIEVQKIMGAAGVAPRIHDAFYCAEDGGVTVMMVMDLMTVGDVDSFSRSRALTNEHRDAILDKVGRMHALGYVHNDLHSGNIFATAAPGGTYEFFLGDFGFVQSLSDDEAEADRERARDLRHVGQVVSFVNRDGLRATLYGLIQSGAIEASVDMRVTHNIGSDCDWDMYSYGR